MERARSEWLRHLGFEQDRLARDEGILFAVRQVTLDFLKPARFNELLAVDVAIVKCGMASLRLAQAVVNGAGEEICTGTVKIACINAESFRPKPIPPSILAELRNGD